MATRVDMIKRLSGGAGNANPNLSLGGVISTASQIFSQSIVYDGSGIAGVTLNEGLGTQLEGVGLLTFDFAATTLVWDPQFAGGSAGTPIDVSIDGDFLIPAAPDNEYILVTVVAASLPGSNTNDTVTITNNVNNLFAQVGGVEAALGSIKYRCYYFRNDAGAGDALNTRIWITQQPAFTGTMIAIGLDPAGIGDGVATGVATTIVDEDTAPAGVSFTAPVTEGTALLIGNLLPGEVQAVWVRRTVPVNELNESDADPSEITTGVSF